MFEKTEKTSLEASAFQGVAQNEAKNMSERIEDFLEYSRYELNFSPVTIIKYRDSLRSMIKDLGDKSVEQYEVQEFVKMKRLMMDRGLSEARISGVVYAVRSFLLYCKSFLKLEVLEPKQIRPPKRFKREVIFLTKEEIEAFINTINIKRWNGLRFRTLVEVLLGTGMRIGEVLSLNRKTIIWEKREAKIIGKGNKERTVFFTKRSLEWITKYLERRNDTHEAIFVTKAPINRLAVADVWRFFDRHRKLAKIDKKLTPHILRHTVATNLVFNGCPIVHVKEILGHERLDTTCKYYLGVDKEKAKKAHKQFLNFI
ncbi:MAG: Tyrosine recombinase XerC [Candidatus Moranbacteria bacterium GW2011_GWC1_45_18]|nr:MAG: Tyrosine recombinase XerC [Candidatus Moranbacteria bacterium GW2011_GWF2_37_7]KKR44358.1 MAG: Tyrosine recombinase XerC [Candidatus Moranbacteria bacterium GW2011_GWC2_40_12]KKU00553.1 MAG: Tyrosine recombinase XerC [Candidatus Moranbacteria bacterium GW2011_GWC1_45_18]